jgi:Ni/Co efflux regulator RcnB
MRKVIRTLIFAAASVGVVSAGLYRAAWADPPPWAGGGHHRDDGQYNNQSDDRHSDDRNNRYAAPRRDNYQITTREQMYINDWYRRNLPPGLAKQGKIPPGHAKKLERGAPWPPPYAYEPLPYELIRNLQPLPQGYAYYRVGADVIIANIAGRVVSDVVYDLLNR